MANQITYKVDYQIDKTTIDDIKRSLQELQKLTAEDLMRSSNGKISWLGDAKEQLKQLKESVTEVSNILNKSFNANLGTLNVTKFNNELNNSKIGLKRIYQDFNSAGTAGQIAFNNITTQALTTNMQLKQTHSLLDSMAVTMKNTIKWSISSAVMNQFTGSIEQAYGYVKNLDRSLNDIRIVTSKSSEDMADFAVQANKAAQGLAASTTDYTNASLIYYQQGLSDEEVAARTEVTLKAANVTQQDTAEVSEQLTAVWNGYKVSAEEAELYVDKLAAVAASTASDLEELSTGMSRVASAASLMGVDVDQLNAQLSTIISVTRQAPESVGTALRGIYARMSDIESGVDVETTLGDYTEEMYKYGINVLNSNNELRDMGEVIEEVGSKWANMTREQQVGLSQAMAGTRQYNNLLALFDNWDNYTDAIETSRNAVGTLQDQQDIYMQGTQAHLQKLKTTWEDLYDSLLTSDDINKVVDIFADLVEGATVFFDTIGGGKNALIGLGAIGSQVFNKQISSGIATSIINLRGLRDNAAKVSAQFEILREFKGIDIDSESAQNLVKMKEQMLEYSNIISTEQQNQANELIKTTNELQNQQLAWEETKKVAQDFYSQQVGVSLDVDKLDENSFNKTLENLKEIKSSVAETKKIYEDFIKVQEKAEDLDAEASEMPKGKEKDKVLSKYNAAINDANEKMAKFALDIDTMIQATAAAPEYIDELSDALKRYNEAVKDSFETDKDGGLGDALVNDKEVKAAAIDLVNIYKDANQKISRDADKTAGTIKKAYNGATAEIEDNLKNVDQAFNNMANSWSIERTVQQYVQLASTIGQVAFAYNSLVNVFNTWKDDDASFGEKMLQTLTAAGTIIPMLVSTYSKLNEVFGTQSILIGYRNGLKEKENALTAQSLVLEGLKATSTSLNAEQEKKLAAAVNKKVIAEGLDIKNLELKQIQNLLEKVAKEENIVLTKEQTKEILTKIEAQRAETIATTKGKIAQDALNASLLANPIIDVVLALTVLIGVLNAVAQAQERAAEASLESSRKSRDTALSYAEENKQLQELYNNYLSYYSVYNQTGEGKEDLKQATLDLCDVLGQEIDTLDLLSDSYDLANKKLNEYTRLKAEEALKEAKGGTAEAEAAFNKSFSEQGIRDKNSRWVSISGGIQVGANEKVADFLSKRINELDLDLDSSITQSGIEIYNIKNAQDLIKVYETLKQAYRDIILEYQNGQSTVYENSKLFQNLGEALAASEDDYEKYIKSREDLITTSQTAAEANAQSLAKELDVGDISSIEDFEKYREQYIQELQKIYDQDGLAESLGLSDEDIEDIADNLLKGIDAISKYAQDFDIKSELRERLSDGADEVENFLKELEENGKLELVATLGVEQGDSIEKIREALEEAEADLGKSALGRAQEAQSALDAVATEKKTKKEMQELEESLQSLGKEYEELGLIQDKTSHEYLSTLRRIKEEEETKAMDSRLFDREKALEEYQKELEKLDRYEYYHGLGMISEKAFNEELNNVEQALQKFIEADHEVRIMMDLDLETDVRDAFGIADEIDYLREAIHDDLYYTLDETLDLIDKGFGAMFINSKLVAEEIEGNSKRASETMIQADKEAMNAFIDSRQAELEADRLAKIEQLEDQKVVLNAQREALVKKLAALNEAYNAEEEADMQTAIAKVLNAEDEYQTQVEIMNNKLRDEADTADEIQGINKTLFDALGGMYEQDSLNFQNAESDATNTQKREIDTRLRNIRILNNAYRTLARQVKASEEGNDLGEIIGGVTQGGGGTQLTGSKDVTTKDVETEGITAEEIQAKATELFNKRKEEYKATVDAAIKSTEKQIKAVDAQIGAADAGIEALKSANLALDRAQENATAGGKKKSKSKSEKDPDLIDFLEDELDRYHDINLELEDLETHLDRLNKQQKKLYGKDLINNLNEQLKILEKQKDAYAVKLEIAKAEKQEIRDLLSSQGVAFDSEGYISNYAEVLQSKLDYVNAVIAKYNAMSAEEQKNFKDTVEKAKKDYEKFKERIERYDELISSFIPDIEDSIQDAIDKEIEINISKFTMAIELRLDMAEAERDFNEFKRKVLDGIKEDDILGTAQSKLKDFTSYFDTEGMGTGPIQGLTDQIYGTIDQINQINETGTSEVYGDDKAKGLEHLKTYGDELMNQLEAVVDLVDEIKESYLDLIDEAVEAFDKQVDQYEYINDLLNHNMNVVGLIYGDKAYEQMARYYEQIENSNNEELDFLRRRVEYAELMMEAETDPKAKEKWEEEWMNALETLNEKVEDSIQNIIDKYENAVSLVFEELNKKVTGGMGLDYVSDEWDLINKNADQYLDTINALYGMQELENKYLEAIDQTDNLSSQKKLNDMMNQQLGMLRDKDKLTQYDVDRANMMYEIALKQIALEEAQQNKSQMRLRRDAQGNYSYQFVSDEDEVAQAQDDLLAAQKDLYNFDKQNYKDNLNDIYEYYVEFQQKYNEIMTDMSLTDEERQERTKLLQEQYSQLINGLVEQNETIKQNLYESTFIALEGMYAFDAESFKEMTGKNIEAFRNLTNAEKDIIIGDLIPQWDSGVQHMADVFAGEGGLIPTCTNAFSQLDQITKDYKKSIGDLETAAGTSFSAIGDGYDKNIEKAGQLLTKNGELLEHYGKELDAIRDVIKELDKLIAKYDDARKAAKAAVIAGYQSQQQEALKALGHRDLGTTTTNEEKKPEIHYLGQGEKVNGNSGSGGGKGNGTPEVGDKVTIKGGLFYHDSYGTAPSGNNQGQWTGKTVYITRIAGGSKPIHISQGKSLGTGDLGWLTKEQLTGYDTGGYTGNWGDSSGKLAVLHQKELILNSSDTENMLAAVNLVRDMAGLLNNLNMNMMNRIMGLSSNFNIPVSDISMDSGSIDQNVHIEATFPNVQNSNEIENAFNNLVNIASQRAYRDRR